MVESGTIACNLFLTLSDVLYGSNQYLLTLFYLLPLKRQDYGAFFIALRVIFSELYFSSDNSLSELSYAFFP